MATALLIVLSMLQAGASVATGRRQAPGPTRDAMGFGASGPLLNYLVLGDSTAAGVGAPYDQGIAVGTAVELGRSHQVTMWNAAVSGARIRDVSDSQLPDALTRVRPDLVLLSVGANDVTHLTPIPSMRARLRAIVRRLRAVNPDVRIVITGSPDMGSPPRIPWLLRGIASLRARMVNRMFRAEVAQQSLAFAPIAEVTGPMFRRDRTLFDHDRFHPNARGYAEWITVLNEALRGAYSRPPARSAGS